MYFYRLKKDTKLHSFGESIGEVPVLGEPLAHYQNKLIRSLGGEVIDISSESEISDSDYILFNEDLLFTPSFLEEVQKNIQGASGSLQMALAPNPFNERFILQTKDQTDDILLFDFFFVKQGSKEFQPQVISQQLFPTHYPVPPQIVRDEGLRYDQCDTFIGRVASPFHLLQLNLALNFMRSVPYRKKMSDTFFQKYFSPFGKFYFFGLKFLNKKGKNCQIHPTAVIEGSIIEDNVFIGAHCVVRFSHIGRGTILEDQSSVTYSVIGRQNHISNKNHVHLCLTYEQVYLIHGPYQFSVFGRNSAVMAVINCDIRLDQENIVIPTDEGFVDSKQALLGVAYGHHSSVGGGNIIAAGRIVPNGLKLPPPEFIKLKFTEKV